MAADFSGYATKAGLKCSDGRTIMPHAFKAQDGMKVPLVWQHGHNEPTNVLGHVLLENRDDGVYCYGYFNNTPAGQNAKALVQHKDIDKLSIYANQLVEKAKQVMHGKLKEVSLVLSGANPGALIDNVTIAHSDGDMETLPDEAVIYTGLRLEHEDPDDPEDEDSDEDVEHADGDPTVREVYESMSPIQKDVVHFMIGAALEADSAEHSESDDDENLNHKEGEEMSRNVFEQNGDSKVEKHALSHDDVRGIVAHAEKCGSLKEAVESYALAHGINNLDTLFPDPKLLSGQPEWDKRRTEWVAGVLNGTSKSPFSRIKTISADITHDEARAKGYIKGSLKKEEFFGLVKRTTGPTTVYKKQKLDRDDIIDITDLDIVAWMKGEMRLMLDEELARAILIGDGRAVDDDDKIKDPAGSSDGLGIRSILNEHELYATTVNVNIDDASSSMLEVMDAILLHRKYWKGTGTPDFYTTEDVITKFLLTRNTEGIRYWRNVEDLASELRVGQVIAVEAMEGNTDLVGIIVNLQDYVLGADKGGEVSMFDDFDIDYNQYKYLIETRLSGALKKIKSALVIKKVAANLVVVTPNKPAFNKATGALTITNQTGVVYKNGAGTTINAAGSPYTVAPGATYVVNAFPASGYYFTSTQVDSWSFTADPA